MRIESGVLIRPVLVFSIGQIASVAIHCATVEKQAAREIWRWYENTAEITFASTTISGIKISNDCRTLNSSLRTVQFE